MSRYDYGLRGPRDTPSPRFPRRRSSYAVDFEERRAHSRILDRVTARYNLDYIRPEIDDESRRFASEWERVGDVRWYRRPSFTRGGTRTMRGAPPRPPDDARRWGPEYGGRYPDEI